MTCYLKGDSYQDFVKYAKSIKKMKRELMELDHDCRNLDPDDGCNWCCMIYDLSDDEIVEKHLEVFSED